MVATDLAVRLRRTFTWRSDRTDTSSFADLTGWWRDAELLGDLGPGLAGLFADERITVVAGVESSGFLLGALTAACLGVGFVGVRKEPHGVVNSDVWLRRTMAPDYQDRQLVLGVRRRLLGAGERVLLVDDWIATGAQAAAVRDLVVQAGAAWVGAAVVVDALTDSRVRRDLRVRAVVHERSLA